MAQTSHARHREIAYHNIRNGSDDHLDGLFWRFGRSISSFSASIPVSVSRYSSFSRRMTAFVCAMVRAGSLATLGRRPMFPVPGRAPIRACWWCARASLHPSRPRPARKAHAASAKAEALSICPAPVSSHQPCLSTDSLTPLQAAAIASRNVLDKGTQDDGNFSRPLVRGILGCGLGCCRGSQSLLQLRYRALEQAAQCRARLRRGEPACVAPLSVFNSWDRAVIAAVSAAHGCPALDQIVAPLWQHEDARKRQRALERLSWIRIRIVRNLIDQEIDVAPQLQGLASSRGSTDPGIGTSCAAKLALTISSSLPAASSSAMFVASAGPTVRVLVMKSSFI